MLLTEILSAMRTERLTIGTNLKDNVYMENGEVVAFTLSVIDVPKDRDLGNDAHGSKIVVIPFDNDALCRFDSDPNTVIE